MATTQELKEKIKLLEEQLDRSKIVVYPKERKLKYFSGKSNENVEEWINDCKLAFCDRFSSGDQIKFVLSHLDGEAKREIRLYGSSFESPDAVFSILSKSFGGSNLYSDAQKKFFERCQEADESVRSFSLALVDLLENAKRIKKFGNEEELLRDHFISGLRDSILRKELRRSVASDSTLTFLQCRETAVQWTTDSKLDSTADSFSPQIRKMEASSEVQDLKKILEKQQQQIDSLTKDRFVTPTFQYGRSRPTPEIICFGCHRPGHIRRDCPVLQHCQAGPRQQMFSPRRPRFQEQQVFSPTSEICFGCNRPGHIRRECPELQHCQAGPRQQMFSPRRPRFQGQHNDQRRQHTRQNQGNGNLPQ